MAILGSTCVEEGVVGETVQERRLLHDLEDGVLNWGRIRSRKGVQVDADDGDAVRELLDILARGVERVEVVQVRKRAEELGRAARLVADNETPFAAALDLENLETQSAQQSRRRWIRSAPTSMTGPYLDSTCHIMRW